MNRVVKALRELEPSPVIFDNEYVKEVKYYSRQHAKTVLQNKLKFVEMFGCTARELSEWLQK